MPPRIDKKVVLPEPDGPISRQMLPRSICSDNPLSAANRCAPLLYTIFTSRALTAVADAVLASVAGRALIAASVIG